MRVAYLLSRYPAVSHTFFLKEVTGLRQRGIMPSVASINPPDRPLDKLPETEVIESAATYYVKSSGILTLIASALNAMVQHPAPAVRGLVAALSLGKWDLHARFYALLYFSEAMLVGRWMRRQGLHHLHVHFGGPVATVGMLAAQAFQIPWSITFHGPDEFFDQEQFYLREKIRSVSNILCISDFCRSQVLRIVPELPLERIRVVRLGVEFDVLQTLVSRFPHRDESSTAVTPVRIVCTGRMVAAKAHRILLEALKLLVEEGVEFEVRLIGDGLERGPLEASCNGDLKSRVLFLGALDHATTLAEVAQADIFVLASFAEGLPVALMEAMAFGVPCVSTTIAAIPELIETNFNGLLVPPANPPALAAALKCLIKSADLRLEMGRRAREKVRLYYNLQTNLDLLAQTWYELTSNERN